MAAKVLPGLAANDEKTKFSNPESERFENIIIGFVGYLGAGCSHVCDSLQSEFDKFGYWPAAGLMDGNLSFHR